MIWPLALALTAVLATGCYLALSRDLLRCLIGLALLGNGVNLLLFASGRFTSNAPPIIAAAEQTLGAAANPVPQALVLTAIVIGFALLGFSLVLGLRIIHLAGHDDVARLRFAEPQTEDPLRPAEEESP